MRYTVTVRAKVTKDYEINAIDEDSAMAEANRLFTDNWEQGDVPSRFEQFVLNITEEK